MPEKLFEEWLSFPDKRRYVPLEEHAYMANQQGWFLSGWQGEAAAVEQLTERPAPAPPPEE